MSTTINAYAFKQQNDNLLALSDAIEDIGRRVRLITGGLPASCKEEVEGLLDRETTAIASTCHCLGEVALAASNEAEHWQSWAEDTNTLIIHNPLKPTAAQVPVTGNIAEATAGGDNRGERIVSSYLQGLLLEVGQEVNCIDEIASLGSGHPHLGGHVNKIKDLLLLIAKGSTTGGQIPPLVVDSENGTEYSTEESILKLAMFEEIMNMQLKIWKSGDTWEFSEGAMISMAAGVSDVRHMLNVALFGADRNLFL